MNLAVLSLPLIPLTWAYAILRYRLMDVDVIFQEGYVYTLATLAVLAIFYGHDFLREPRRRAERHGDGGADSDRGVSCSSRSATGFRSSSTGITSTRTATTTAAR